MILFIALLLGADAWADADLQRYESARLNRTGPLVVYVGIKPDPKLPGLEVGSLPGIDSGVLYLPKERGWRYWFKDVAALRAWLIPPPVSTRQSVPIIMPATSGRSC